MLVKILPNWEYDNVPITDVPTEYLEGLLQDSTARGKSQEHIRQELEDRGQPAALSTDCRVMPIGQHKGTHLKDIDNNDLERLWCGWNSNNRLRSHPFFKVIGDELNDRGVIVGASLKPRRKKSQRNRNPELGDKCPF